MLMDHPPGKNPISPVNTTNHPRWLIIGSFQAANSSEEGVNINNQDTLHLQKFRKTI